MGVHKNNAYSLRLENELMNKIKKIAEKEDRPLSKQFERIIRQFVDEYEQKNGSINTVNIGRDNNGTINMK